MEKRISRRSLFGAAALFGGAAIVTACIKEDLTKTLTNVATVLVRLPTLLPEKTVQPKVEATRPRDDIIPDFKNLPPEPTDSGVYTDGGCDVNLGIDGKGPCAVRVWRDTGNGNPVNCPEGAKPLGKDECTEVEK